MYLFDTDTLSNLMKRTPSSRLLSRIRSTPVPAQFTSSITLGELIYGAQMEGISEAAHPDSRADYGEPAYPAFRRRGSQTNLMSCIRPALFP